MIQEEETAAEAAPDDTAERRTELPLDFMIIGAQKGGTTSLFHYLKGHPEIYLPPDKELPYFNRPYLYGKGWQRFYRSYYEQVPPGRRLGKASSQYLHDPDVPARIQETMPDTRLIAILRDPIERAVSHYKMAVRREMEPQPVDAALRALMADRERTEAAREMPALVESEPHCYLVWGEYGRQLARFREQFPREQMLVLFTEELAADPAGTLDTLLRFLGLEPGYRPPNLGKRYHVGGTQRRIRLLGSEWVQAQLLRVPGRFGQVLRFNLEVWNVRPEPTDADLLPRDLRTELTAYYRDDVRLLESLIGRAVPWRAWKG